MTNKDIASPASAELASDMTAEQTTQHMLSIPFMKCIGMKAVKGGRDGACMAVPLSPPVTAIGDAEAFSDGITAAAIDQAGSAALTPWLNPGTPMATLSLDVTFIQPARGPEMLLESECQAISHNVGHTRVRALNPDGGVAAHGSVNYMVGSFPGGVSPSGDRMGTDSNDTVDGVPIPPLAGNSFSEAVAGTVERPGCITIPFSTSLVGSREQTAFHGGMIAAAAIKGAKSLVPDLVISHLVVDYLRAGNPKDLTATATLVHSSRKTATVRIEVTQDGGERHVATATARFVLG
jgi:acyl-coenzyme A thioesterase PaaI-like protein